MFKFKSYLIALFIGFSFSLSYVNASQSTAIVQLEISDEVFEKYKQVYSNTCERYEVIKENIEDKKASSINYIISRPDLLREYNGIIRKYIELENSIPAPLEEITKKTLTKDLLRGRLDLIDEINKTLEEISQEALTLYNTHGGKIAAETIEETSRVIEQKATESNSEAELIEKVSDHYSNLSTDY